MITSASFTSSPLCEQSDHLMASTDNRIRRFVKMQYQRKFDATIVMDYPNLIAVADANNNLLSALGYRDAATPLFAEHYTVEPIEITIANLYEDRVSRSDIVEIGNLAAVSSRHAISLLQQTWQQLNCHPYEYIVFTGTQAVIRLFKSLPYHVIAQATPRSVPHGQRWGSYYANKPIVVCARLEDYDQRFGFRGVDRTNAFIHTRDGERV